MPVPTWRLAVLMAASAVLLLVVPAGYWIVEGTILAIVTLDTIGVPSRRRIHVSRTVAPLIEMDVTTPISWQVRADTGHVVHLWVADQVVPSFGLAARRFSAAVPAGATVGHEDQVRPSRRGRFEIGPIHVRMDGPLRLMARQFTYDVRDVVRVLPPFWSRAEADIRIQRARLLEVGLRTAKGRGSGTEFESLREYTTDDEFRRIDWAATARGTRTVVRTYRAERNQTVLILLDNGRALADQVESAPRVEHAMDAIMMLTAVATRLGDRVGLVAFDRDIRVTIAASSRRRQFGIIAEALAELEPELVEADVRSAVGHALGRRARRSLVVLCTELRPAIVEETLLPGMAALRHHLVIVAAVRDPALERWAGAHASTSDEVFRVAAATAALEARRRAIARLRGAGAVVIDAAPGKLATQLADTYLEMKATGRL